MEENTSKASNVEMTTREKLAEARKAKEHREAVQRSREEDQELVVLQLEEKLETVCGPRGKQFEIVETLEGPIAVRLGEGVLHTRFQASKMEETDIHDYVFPNVVHPSREEYLAIVARRPGVALRCASALATLYGAKAGSDAKKF